MPEDHVPDDLLTQHFMDDLDPAESDVIHRHLEACASCDSRADKIAETMAALAALGDDFWSWPSPDGSLTSADRPAERPR
uniref:zf-HC2 domain-containing protein n=1 Tax=Paractinoplanes polyasparticus TaxID=2856853 RepID=UPI001C8429AD|nr:zf-HC2 domain-containing protein [Actinoplanes polyasparticus]